MNKIKYYCLRYQPYLLGVAFFLAIFLVWAIGRALGFASLHSLLAGIGAFLLLSAGYVLLLYRGAGQHHNLEGLLRDDADQAVLSATPADREEVSLLRERLLQSIERLHSNKARGASAKDALYALPWYLVIGQPAAGKSTMILQSGLNFPYAEREGARVAGLGGTRNCDWFFSSEAVLLDTAGRYMNSPEEAGKWRGFLQLLRQHRQRRPLNGLIVSVSIADILHGSAEDQERVAKRLRERIQESCALLEVRLPIYLVFTKCDLIPGFTPFYRQLDDAARGEVMGKTFSHKGYEQADWGQRFGNAMDELASYWRQVAGQQLVHQDIQVTRQNNAAYRFPLELAALKPRLQQFVDSLLRANPYQNAELLRGSISPLRCKPTRPSGAATASMWPNASHSSRLKVLALPAASQPPCSSTACSARSSFPTSTWWRCTPATTASAGARPAGLAPPAWQRWCSAACGAGRT